MADSKEKLFSDFPAVSTEQWIGKDYSRLRKALYFRKEIWFGEPT